MKRLKPLLGCIASLSILIGGISQGQSLVPTALPPEEVAPSARVARDEAAREAFRNLNFFSQGGGMHLPPNLWALMKKPLLPLANRPYFALEKREMSRRWGINWIGGKPEGIFDVRYKNHEVGVLGCVACHSGKAAGQFFVGLGNKNIDPSRIGRDAHLLERVWKYLGHVGKKDADYKYIESSAFEFSRTLGDPSYGNLTQGLVPTSNIRTWFYKMAGKPLPKVFPRSAVKVPALWGYGEKRKVGQFCDGFGNGAHPGWGIAVELAAGQRVDVVRDYLPKISAAEDMLGDFLPPKYPFAIEQTRAVRGKAIFERSCAHCHGTYETDPAGLPVYQAPKYLPWEMVETDRDRIDGITDEFLDLVRASPLNDVVQNNADKGKGYFAQRLNGIWARFPYLHNGSVPNIESLLTPPAQRPKAFDLRDAGEAYRFDPNKLGLTLPEPGSPRKASF
jgi:hypothetical protein